MKISADGIKFIEIFEGIKFKSYICPAGMVTIGIGTTLINNKLVELGTTCTYEDAVRYFDEHLSKYVYPTIEKKIKVPLNQNQFDAIVSLIYNIGQHNFEDSTLLKLLNSGDYDAASKEFPRWNKANKKVMSGLTTRRLAEQKLFNTAG